MGSTNVVLLNEVVQGGTERSGTIIEVELKIEGGPHKSDLKIRIKTITGVDSLPKHHPER